MKVKRFLINDFDEMVINKSGDWVAYEDYKKLEAENKELSGACKLKDNALKTVRNYCDNFPSVVKICTEGIENYDIDEDEATGGAE